MAPKWLIWPLNTEAGVQAQARSCGFVADSVALGQVYFYPNIWCSVTIIPPMLHTHISFICHSYHKILAVNSIKLSISLSILIRSNKMQQMQVFITAKLLYMFRVCMDPIIRSTSNCNCSFWYRSCHVSGQRPSASVV